MAKHLTDTTGRLFADACRVVGLPGFIRECRVIMADGHWRKAWRVPGTQEAGEYNMIMLSAQDVRNSWELGQDFGGGYPMPEWWAVKFKELAHA